MLAKGCWRPLGDRGMRERLRVAWRRGLYFGDGGGPAAGGFHDSSQRLRPGSQPGLLTCVALGLWLVLCGFANVSQISMFLVDSAHAEKCASRLVVLIGFGGWAFGWS